MTYRASFVLLGVLLFLASLARLSAQDPLVQRWYQLYDQGAADTNESARKVALDAAGNVFVAGYSDSNRTGTDIVVHKYNRNTGTLLWEARYNNPNNGYDYVNDIAVDGAGNAIITGYIYNGSSQDIYTAKYSGATGALIWEVIYDGPANLTDYGNALAVDAAGNVVIAGYTYVSSTNSDYYTAKYAAADGALLWEKTYNGTGNSYDIAQAVAVDGAGNAIVTGYSYPSNSYSDYYTVKYDALDGHVIWEKRYNGPANRYDYAYDVAADASGNAIVTGYSYSYNSSANAYRADYYTAKYAAADGALLWEKRYDGPGGGSDTGYRVAVDSAGNAIVTGYSQNSAGSSYDIYTAKYAAADGALLWEKRQNGGYGYYLALDSAGNAIIGGTILGTNGSGYYTAKLSAGSGAVLWEKKVARPATQSGYAGIQDVAVDGSDNVIATGSIYPHYTNYDFYTVKYAGSNGSLMWENRHNKIGSNDDNGRGVALDGAGNVIVTGTSPGQGTGLDFYTAKHSAATGSLLWANRYNGPANDTDEARAVAVDDAGNVIVTGTSYNGTSNDIATIKYSGATGSVLWEKRHKFTGHFASYATALALDAAGNVIIAGYTFASSGAQSDFYTVKLAGADGTLIWEKRYNGPGNHSDSAIALALDGAGNVIVTGTSNAKHPSNDNYYTNIATVKYAAANGALLWEQHYGGSTYSFPYDYSTAVAVDGAGNAVITGYTYASNGYSDYYTAKYAAADGALIWEKRYNNASANRSDSASAVAADADGNVFVTGSSSSYNSGANAYYSDFYTVKYAAADGAVLWEKRYNGPDNLTDSAYALKLDEDGNAVVSGTTESKIYTLVYAGADGEVLKEAFFVNPTGGYTYPSKLALGPGGVIAITGYASYGPSGDDDILALIYGLYDTPVPQITVSGNAVNIANGDNTPSLDDHSDFGLAQVTAGSVERTFTLSNPGTGPLTLTGSPKVQVSGAHAADFTVAAQPDSPVAAQTATAFTITFTPSAAGLRTAAVSIASDDADDNPFTFAIQGYGTLLQPATVLLSNLAQAPDGTPKTVTVTTIPPGLNVVVTYNGESTLPADLGAYAVFAVVDDPAYEGFATATLVLDHRADRQIVEPPPWENGLPATNDLGVWSPNAPGIYDGLLRDDADDYTLLGTIENLKVSKAKKNAPGGAVSGVARLNGQAIKLRGAFKADGSLSVDANLKGGIVVEVRLWLRRVLPGGDDVISGTVTWKQSGQPDLVALAYLPRAAGVAPVAHQGKFTMLLPSQLGWGSSEPGGDGWGAVTVSKTGLVTVKGKLGDGTAFTEKAYLSANGEFFLYRELYKSKPEKGRIGGRVLFRDLPWVSDFDGRLQWKKFEDAKEKQYKDGFNVEVALLGSRLISYPNGIRLLGALDDADPNAVFNLIGPSLPPTAGQEVERVLSWLLNNKLVHYGPEKLSGSANRSTGLLTGSFLDPASKLRVQAQGVVFQKQELAAGQFVLGAGSGALRIKPGTSFPYPGGEDAGVGVVADVPAGEAAPPGLSDQSLEPGAAGTYGGVFGDGSGVAGALENVKVTATGAVSGVLWLGGVKYTFRDQLSGDNPATATITVDGLTITLILKKENAPATGCQLAGTVADGSETYTLAAQRLPSYSGGQAAPQEGGYTVALLAPAPVDPTLEPGGDGYGTLKVSKTGVITGALVLAEGTKTTFAGHVTEAGEWSFYRTLYGGNPARGYLGGKLMFRNEAGVSDVDGFWRWVKQNTAVTKPAVYTSGIQVTRQVVGAIWTPPGKNERAWEGLADDWHNIWSRWAGPNLSTTAVLPELDRVATWTTANKVLYFGPDKLAVKVNAKTGLVTGSYKNPAQGVNQSFGGVLLQKQGLVTGSYVNANGSGRFWMQGR